MSLIGLAQMDHPFFRATKAIRKYFLILLVAILIVATGFMISLYGKSESSDAEAQIELLLRQRMALQEAENELLKLKSKKGASQRSYQVNYFHSADPGEGFQKLNENTVSKYIPKGSVFKARLISSIKTSLQATFVMAEVTQTFQLDSIRSIPKKSRLIGSAVFDSTTKGVVVKFDTLTSPSGLQYDGLNLLALSEKAWPQVDGIYFDDSGTQLGTALAFGFLSGFSDAGKERESGAYGSYDKNSISNQVLSGVSGASFQVAENALHKLEDRSFEYVVVPAGSFIYVAVLSKLELPVGGIR